MSRKILIVFGTRPEAIKLAPVIKRLREHPKELRIRVCVSGQHRQLLDSALHLFRIRPDYDLRLMRPHQSLAHIVSEVLKGLDPILQREKPDWILVQGDTTTALAASLAGFYRKIRVAHVEAGLRTSEIGQPFPEEINRRMIDQLANLHFAPTRTARQNLLREGFSKKSIHITGNTVIDALLEVAGRPFSVKNSRLRRVPTHPRIVLVTAHRRENFGQPIQNLCEALRIVAKRLGGQAQIVYPVHRNPQVWFPVHALLGRQPYITLLPPLDYRELVYLMKLSHFILTDSGGLQEEAPNLGKPVLVFRNNTERPEGVEAGTVKVIGTETDDIVAETCRLFESEAAYARMAQRKNPYGGGSASRRIVEVLRKFS